MLRRWKSASLRSQLVVIMAVLMVVTVTITGLATIYVLRQILISRLDTDIQDNAGAISRYLVSGSPSTDASPQQMTMARCTVRGERGLRGGGFYGDRDG